TEDREPDHPEGEQREEAVVRAGRGQPAAERLGVPLLGPERVIDQPGPGPAPVDRPRQPPRLLLGHRLIVTDPDLGCPVVAQTRRPPPLAPGGHPLSAGRGQACAGYGRNPTRSYTSRRVAEATSRAFSAPVRSTLSSCAGSSR